MDTVDIINVRITTYVNLDVHFMYAECLFQPLQMCSQRQHHHDLYNRLVFDATITNGWNMHSDVHQDGQGS